jgi:hypothetical protein
VSVLASVSLVSAVKYLTSTLHFPFGAPHLPAASGLHARAHRARAAVDCDRPPADGRRARHQ